MPWPVSVFVEFLCKAQEAVSSACVSYSPARPAFPAAVISRELALFIEGMPAKVTCCCCCCCAQAEVFEEIATMDYPFEGIPTIPPRKNTTHMAAFCNGCRYRVTANPDMTVAEV
jgi:hypothetical protein